jgi:hypothetical protein
MREWRNWQTRWTDSKRTTLAKWLLATVPAKPIEITEEIAIPCFPVIPAKSA